MYKFDLTLHPKQAQVFKDKSRFKVMVCGRRFGKCNTYDTPVHKADGTIVKLGEIKPKDMILSFNSDNYQFEPKHVVSVTENGIQPTVTIKLRSGQSITSTLNHPHLVNNKWTEVGNIKIGDLVALTRTPPFGNEVRDFKELDALSMWLAEGSGFYFTNENKLVFDRFKEAMLHFKCDLTKANHSEERNLYWRYRSISGKKNGFADYLRSLNLFDKTSKTKFIPEFIYRLNEDCLARFLNGWFATDGCISKDGHIEIGLANENMVKQIRDLLMRFGIHGSIYHKIHNQTNKDGKPFESWTWRTKKSDAIIAFCDRIGALGKEEAVDRARAIALKSRGNCNEYIPISHDDFIKIASYEPVKAVTKGAYQMSVPLDMPRELLDELRNWRKQDHNRMSLKRFKKMHKWTNGQLDHLIENIIWEEVTEIIHNEPEMTYAMEVADNNTFVSDGIVTHNTVTCLSEIIFQALSKPNQKIWYVAPTYKQAKRLMWDELKKKIPKKFVKKFWEVELRMLLRNGSEISLFGADKPDGLRGSSLDLLCLDEYQDFKPGIFEKVLYPMLSDRRGRVVVAGTPKSYNLLYDLYIRGETPEWQKQGWKSWQFLTSDNPFIPLDEIEAARANLDPKSFRQEYMASFESVSGKVYYAFDRKLHASRFLPFNPKLPIWLGQDFNIDPMSTVVIQPQPNGQLWVVDEFHLPNTSTHELAEHLENRFFKPEIKKMVEIYPDPAGAFRGHTRGESDLDILRQMGFRKIYHRRKHPPVADRINAVNRMLMTASGDVQLFISNNCKELIKSLEQTIYKEGSRQVNKKLGTEHMADALGYPLEFRFPVIKKQIYGISR